MFVYSQSVQPTVLPVRVVKNHLKGSLPSEMRHLSMLDYLDMEQNSLVGSIPEELGYLTNLKYLGLAANNLEGQIPSTLGGIDNLGTYPNGRRQFNDYTVTRLTRASRRTTSHAQQSIERDCAWITL